MTAVRGSNYMMPNEEELDEFLTKVEDVTTKVRDLLDGKISVEDIEKEEKDILLKKRIKEIKREEEKEKEKRQFIMGREGKGNEDDYLFFCRYCFVEYNYHLTKCKRCNNVVVSKEERKKELNEKVRNYKNLKDKRNVRRSLWHKYLKENGDLKKNIKSKCTDENKCNDTNKHIVNYEKWDHYEPSTDTFDEDEKMVSYTPKNNKNFQLLEKKIDDDISKKKEHKNIAYTIKMRGNTYFKEKKYMHAIDCYKDAINICKDYLSVYNNLALCYIKMHQYENSIQNCDKVIEYYTIFRNDFTIKKDVMFKSYSRKALALYKLHRFSDALESFQLAHSFDPTDEQVIEYIQKCTRILQDRGRAAGREEGKEVMYGFAVQNSKECSIEREKMDEMICNPSLEGLPRDSIEISNQIRMNKSGEKNGENVEAEINMENLLRELSKLDVKKNDKKFYDYLKNVKKVIVQSEVIRLAFCSCAYELESKCNDRRKQITFLSFLVDTLNNILFYVKKELGGDVILKNDDVCINYEQVNISTYLKKCGNIIIGILTFILEESYHYSDFCINALKPVLTFYLIRKFSIPKCIYFICIIGKNENARKYFYHEIVQDSSVILKKFLEKLDDYIRRERSMYTEERMACFHMLRKDILKPSELQIFSVDMDDIMEKAADNSGGETSAVKRSDAEGSTVKRSDAEGSTVKRSDAEGSTVKRSDAEETTVKRSDAEGSTVKRSDAEGSTVKRSDAEGSTVKRSDAEGSTVKRSDAEGSTVKRSDAEGSTVKRSDAEGSTVKRSDAEGSTVKRSDAEETTVKRSDAEGSTVKGTSVERGVVEGSACIICAGKRSANNCTCNEKPANSIKKSNRSGINSFAGRCKCKKDCSSKGLERKMIRMYEEKYEFVNLFEILSNFTILPDVLNVLEKYFMKYILNIVIYINEQFYNFKDMHRNYLSLMINLVGHKKIRSFFIRTCWIHIFYFVEKCENIILIKSMLSLIFNLTVSWNEEIKKDIILMELPIHHIKAKNANFVKLLHLTQSNDTRVSELSFLLLSRFYLYLYYVNTRENTTKETKICSHNVEYNSNKGDKSDLVNNLRTKIYKENDNSVQLDAVTFILIKKSLLTPLLLLSSKNNTTLTNQTNACINFICCLSKYTNFFTKILFEESTDPYGDHFIKTLSDKMVSIFLHTKGSKDMNPSSFVLLNNVVMFFTQILKNISLKSGYNCEAVPPPSPSSSSSSSSAAVALSSAVEMAVVAQIKIVIPHAMQLLTSPEKKLNKNISILLSYCFINSHLKPTILSLYNHDIERIYYALRIA
ncbi:TPR domain containing protein [Plasmodium malariae]|uniref:TPR domain containing protein n=1 Tax=Plasmodium malariae TaxID=5858 RepID=A0A1C3KYN0_PLAMA|nr:TPR domain containing protein [Plasmodium malariae]